MTRRAAQTLLRDRCALFNRRLVDINDELAALAARSRDLERALLQTMGQKLEAEFLLTQLEDRSHDKRHREQTQ
jgi:hypothetical protein